LRALSYEELTAFVAGLREGLAPEMAGNGAVGEPTQVVDVGREEERAGLEDEDALGGADPVSEVIGENAAADP